MLGRRRETGAVQDRLFSAADWRIAMLLAGAATSLILLTTGGHLTSTDELTMLRTTQALLHGDRNLNAFMSSEGDVLATEEHRKGEYVGSYGIGSSVTGAIGYLAGKGVATWRPSTSKRRSSWCDSGS